MRTKLEQTRRPTAETVKEVQLQDGPDYFPKRFPDKDCVLVIKRKVGNVKFQETSDHLAYRRMGYEILSKDEKDTWDPDCVWMGIDKKILEARRARIPELEKAHKFEPVGDQWGRAAKKGYAVQSKKGLTLAEMEEAVIEGRETQEKLKMVEAANPDFFERLEQEVETS